MFTGNLPSTSACAFTGHRPMRFSFGYDEENTNCQNLKKMLAQEIWRLAEQGVKRFYTGMAQGVDIWAAEIVLQMKKTDKDIELIAVRPCDTQAVRWSAQQQARYFDILGRVDNTVLISQRYTPSCMFERNRYMVDHADYLIAVYDGGGKGGTAYTVQYAQKKGLHIFTILPDLMDVEVPTLKKGEREYIIFRPVNGGKKEP